MSGHSGLRPQPPKQLTASIQAKLEQGLALQQQGRLIEAELYYQEVLRHASNNFNALHLLGVLAVQTGRPQRGVELIRKAIKLDPNFAIAHDNLGNCLRGLGRFKEALASHEKAIALKPNYAAAHFNRGNTLRELNRFEEALASYDHALTIRADYAEALFNRGLTLHVLKRFEEALASYDRALTMRPEYPEALSNRGITLHELQRFEDALASYDRALTMRPEYPEALSNRGLTLHVLKRFEEALASYECALTIRPDYPEALSNRGSTLHELQRFEDALASYDRALTMRPEYPETLSNRGNTLKELKRFEEALENYNRAITMRPEYPEALSNRGNTLKELKRFEEALENYNRAITMRPDFAEAHYNEALLRLLTGDFGRGWGKYEWRLKSPSLSLLKRNFCRPLWLGADSIDGKTILLHSEQGLGDTLQFCRYVPLIAARGAYIILEVQRPLQELMTTLAGATQVISKGDPLPDFDFQCPLLSLPLALGTRHETVRPMTPYLRPSVEALNNWQVRLGPKARPKIGLVWSGSPMHNNDKNRSISLRSLIPLLDIEATFVSLQKDVRSNDMKVLKDQSDLLHFGDELKNFSDTAALVSNLDLVISVDTSVAHLAGALGKPVWVMLPFVPDWRWLLDREDSPWYPTARLFRQDDTREWNKVITRIDAELRDYVRNF